ncbi:MAG: methyltransferase domain-containing protein [Candidatus Sumerlaeia bacterium]|nr:methyltransferase domain-containing protein [Candidatus Sumerlaeia bacterium]
MPSQFGEIDIFLNILTQYSLPPGEWMLDLGCGEGTECVLLAERTNARVIGIDYSARIKPSLVERCLFIYGDATALPFRDCVFDGIYSYHVLEHIPEPAKALREMNRILKPGGYLFVGTPNKSRIIAYLDARGTPILKRLSWNLNDWWARICGRFNRESGAHCGFTNSELQNLLKGVFRRVYPVESLYYQLKYQKYRRLIEIIAQLKIKNLLFPSIYFLCLK